MNTKDKRILNINHIMPYDSKGTKAWLVRFNYYPDKNRNNQKCHSKLFAFSKYPTPDAALDAARAYRDEWFEKHKHLLWLKEKGHLNLKLPKNNTSGILGVNRTTRLSRVGTIEEQWQSSVNQPDGKIFSKQFSIRRYGELQAMRLAIEARKRSLEALQPLPEYAGDKTIAPVIAYYADILANLDDLKDTSVGPSILDIAKDETQAPTSKYDQIMVRIGQQRFRREVLEYFDNICAVTHSPILVRASHIKPWRACNDSERLDKMNGLALSPTYDAAFDAGVVSFRNDGCILVAREFTAAASMLGITGQERINCISDAHAKYLDWHRNYIFSRNTNSEIRVSAIIENEGEQGVAPYVAQGAPSDER